MKMKAEVFILCGGQGKRLGGKNKGLLTLCGKTFLEYLTEKFSKLGSVTVVGRKDEFSGLGVRAIDDETPGLGPMGGILTALKVASSDYILVLACDMPIFPVSAGKRLLEAASSFDADAAVIFTDRLTPIPGVYRKNLIELFEKSVKEGRLSLTRLVLNINAVLLHHRGFEGLRSVNTPQDYQMLVKTYHCEEAKDLP